MFQLPNANYKFTDKKLSPFSVMSMVLSGISLVAILVSVIISFNLAGVIDKRIGVSMFLCLIFSLTAVGFSIRTYFQKNVFHVFSNIGLAVGMVNLFFIMYVYGIGIMG